MTSLEDEVAAAEARWNATYLAGDVEAFGALLAHGFLYLSERGSFEREEYLSNLASGVIEMRGLSTLASRARVFGEVVVVTGEARMDASFQGRDISGTDRYTRVWHRGADGRLRAVSQHASAAPPAERPGP